MAIACFWGLFSFLKVCIFFEIVLLDDPLLSGMMKPRTGKTLACRHCGNEFYVPKHRFATASYCSLKCHYADRVTKQICECKQCGKTFEVIFIRKTTAKYCSNSCKAKAYRNRCGSVECKCKSCGKKFKTNPSTKRIYCSSKCYGIGQRVELFKNTQGVRKALNRRGLIKECNKCGYNEHPYILGVHHKNKNNKDNRIENLEILCPNCHSLEHRKHISH